MCYTRLYHLNFLSSSAGVGLLQLSSMLGKHNEKQLHIYASTAAVMYARVLPTICAPVAPVGIHVARSVAGAAQSALPLEAVLQEVATLNIAAPRHTQKPAPRRKDRHCNQLLHPIAQ